MARMRDLSQTPSLFEEVPPPAVPSAAPHQAPREERRNENLAREFLRWCFSFGKDFRNSPDVTNLRFWIRKARLKLKEKDESEILGIVRPLFVKRLEQLVRKSEAAN
jgi:hypothetical protein